MKRGARDGDRAASAPTLQRRAFLRLAVAGVTATMTACGSMPAPGRA